MALTFTVWLGRFSWQFGAQLPMLLASDTRLTVALPERAPAADVSMPTDRLPVVAPGASRLKLPPASTGAPLVAMLPFSAACGLPVAWLSTDRFWLAAVLMRTLPRATLTAPGFATPLITGRAWSITLAWMVPRTP